MRLPTTFNGSAKPIELIVNSWGGTAIKLWMPPILIQQCMLLILY